MKMTFEVIIDIDEATPDEMEEAIAGALRVLDMPNDDRIYIDHPRVTYKRPRGPGHSCDIPGCAVRDPCHGL